MTTALLMARPKPTPRPADAATQERNPEWPVGAGSAHTGAPDRTYLVVVVSGSLERRQTVFDEWQAELKLAECSRNLPLAWPLPDWLDDYRALLVRALCRETSTRKKQSRTDPWNGEITEFLRLMLGGQDKSAGEFIRTLTHAQPFADELRRLRRVQALFALIRPARSLAEALDFAIVRQQGQSP